MKSTLHKMVKKVSFAIMAFMVLNAYFAQNMSASEVDDSLMVKRCDYYAALCEEYIPYVDEYVDHHNEQAACQTEVIMNDLNGHKPIVEKHQELIRCAVCKLEEG